MINFFKKFPVKSFSLVNYLFCLGYGINLFLYGYRTPIVVWIFVVLLALVLSFVITLKGLMATADKQLARLKPFTDEESAKAAGVMALKTAFYALLPPLILLTLTVTFHYPK